MTSPQFRGALRGTIAALGLAVAATVNFVFPGLPDHMAAVKARVWATVKAYAFERTVGEAMKEAAG